MLKIGLTGGIGSGKSTVTQIFKILGIPVFDADTEAKKLMETNAIIKQALIEEFGEAVFDNNILNRKYLSSIVFVDTYKLDKLNAIVHPVAIEAALQWAAKQHAPYIIKEAALLFEAGSANNLDFIIGVNAPQAIRLQRVMHRDNVGRQDVLNRMSKQINPTLKMKLCDFVIQNNEQQLLIPQVVKLHQHFLQLANTTA
jgi:dephospho-CoA kinase